MHRKLAWGDDGDIIAKADMVANELSKCVECDGVYISLAGSNRLYSFGMTGPEPSVEKRRVHEVADTVCGVTIELNQRQVLNDARSVDRLAAIPYVASGNVVGYLGQPIRDGDTNAIGAICAVTAKPRVWSEVDMLNLQLSCMETEYLLATELLQSEMTFLSQALGDYDNVLMALTNNMKLMTSVHGADGELLFATNALMQEIDASDLEDAFRWHQAHQVPAASAEGPHASGPDTKLAPSINVLKKPGKTGNWHATIRTCPGSVSFVSWKPRVERPA